MPRKRTTLEQRIVARTKTLGITLDELRRQFDAGNPSFQHTFKQKPAEGSLRLVIRCGNKAIPRTWSMSLLLNNVRIDGIDYHRTDFISRFGERIVGFHRDMKTDPNGPVQKVKLNWFMPETLEQFIEQGFVLLKIKGGKSDGSDELRIR